MAEKSENTEHLVQLKYILWGAIGLLVLLYIIYFSYFHYILFPITDSRYSMWGTFGDFMGGTLNPLFALLSLYAIIITIRIQTSELKLTREAMQDQRDAQLAQNIAQAAQSEAQVAESKAQSEAQEEQSKSFKIQNESIKLQTFENTFFKLLELHNILIQKTNINEYHIKQSILQGYYVGDLIKNFEKVNRTDIKKYFMTLYQILKFVDDQRRNFENETYFKPKLYTNIIRATFDDALLIALAINCILEDFEDYKNLVVEYSLFEHLNIEFIMSETVNYSGGRNYEENYFTSIVTDLLSKYHPKAFGSNDDLKGIIANPPPISQSISEEI